MATCTWMTRRVWLAAVIACWIGMTSCGGDNNGGGGGGPDDDPGHILFWTDESVPGNISVTLDGSNIGTITSHLTSTPSGCSASGAVSVEKDAGTYDYSASGPNGLTWSGTVTSVSGQCRTVRLYSDAPVTGKVVFWTDQNVTGPITVNVGGSAVGTITVYGTTAPACGTTGAVTVDLAPGTYTYTASANGVTWGPSTVTSVAGQCRPQLLTYSAPATGQIMFWTASNASGQIAVSVDGTPVGTITAFHSSAPACGAAGTVTITRPVGTHTFSATGANGDVWPPANVTVVAGACNKAELVPPAPTTGQVMFWTAQNSSGQITVSLDGSVIGTLTSFLTTPPACGGAGTITVTRPAGAHTYTATSTNGGVWSSTPVNVTAGGCTSVQLLYSAPTQVNLSIYSAYNAQIDVWMNGGAVGRLTTFFPTGQPACGGTGTITRSFALGSTVRVQAQTTGLTRTWDYNIGPLSLTCSLFALT